MENKITLTFKNNKLLKNSDTSKLNFNQIKGKLVTLKEGEILYREGDPSEYIYLIVSGQVKVIAKDELENSQSLTLTENDFFGHLDFYESTFRKTSAFGAKDCYLIAVSKAEMNNLLWQDAIILQNLKTLCSFSENKDLEKSDDSFNKILNDNIIEDDIILDDVIQDLPNFNSFNLAMNDDLEITPNLDDEKKLFDENLTADMDNFKLDDFNKQNESESGNIELVEREEPNLTEVFPEFVDDEEPENIEMNFSEDFLINQFNTSGFVNDDKPDEIQTNPVSEENKSDFSINSNFYKQFDSINSDNVLENLQNDELNVKEDKFSLEGFTTNEFKINDSYSLENTEGQLGNNFLSDFNNTQLNNFPKSFDEFDKTEIIDNANTPADLNDSDLFNTNLGAIRFEDDDIIKPEGDIEELEQMEGFNKEQFLKSEFEDLYKNEEVLPNYEDKNINFEFSASNEEPKTFESAEKIEQRNENNFEELIPEKIKEELPITTVETNIPQVQNTDGDRAVMNIEQLKMILKAAQLVSSKIKLDDVLQNIVSVATNLTNCDRGTLYLVDKDKNEIWSKVAMGNELKEIRLKIGDGVAGWVAKTGEIVNISDAQTDSRFKSSFDKTSGYQTKSMICFPIKNVEGEIIGVHQLLNSRNGKFNKLDEEFLNAISIHASIALENAELVEKLLQFERISSLGKMANFLIQDIKNPVLISKKYTEHLKNKNLPQDITRILDMILEQLNQVADLVLTTSNYSEKNKVLRQINTNIISVLNDYTSRVDALVRKKNCAIVNRFDVDAIVRVDLKEFYQGYQHIIKNATEAMPDGGTITVTTEKENNFVKISISDSGLGIPDSIKDKIFDPFMSHGKKEGTGLGLSITKKIIQEHGGSIFASSSLGQGSTFVIRLPITQDF
ncbi:MAG: ATP-binding protein [bacterium]